MRWCKIIGLTLLLLILMAGGGMLWLVGSNSGLNFLGNTASRWLPGFSIGRIEGNLRDLTLRDLHYQQPGITLQADAIHLALQPGCLLRGRLCVADLTVDNTALHINSQQWVTSPAPAPQQNDAMILSVPLPLQLTQVTVHNFSLNIDHTRLTVHSLRTGIYWQQNNITLLPTVLQNVDLILADNVRPPAATSAITQPVSLAEQLQQLFSQPLFVPPAEMILPVNLTIAAFKGEQLRIIQGTQPFAIQYIQLQASSTNGLTKLHQLQIDSDYGQLTANGELRTQGKWPLKLTFNSNFPLKNLPAAIAEKPTVAKAVKQLAEKTDKPPAKKVVKKIVAKPQSARMDLALSGTLADTLQLQGRVSGALNLALQGEVQLTKAGLPFQLSARSARLAWPLAGDAQYQLNNLRLKAGGKVTNYHLQLDMALYSKQAGDGQLTLQAAGNERQLTIKQLRLATLQGSAQLQGKLDWQTAFNIQANLTLDGINSAKQFPQWPVSLDGKLALRASLDGAGWQVAVSQLRIDGKVKKNPLTLSGNFTGNSKQQWTVPSLQLTLGANHVQIHGQLGVKNQTLNASMHTPALDAFLPGLAGNIQGAATLGGSISAGQLTIDLHGNGLRWQDLVIGKINLSADARNAKQLTGQLRFSAAGISQGTQQISQLTLTASGNEQAHQLQLLIQGKPVSGKFSLRGSYNPAQRHWRGKLYDSQLLTPVGSWTPDKEISLDYRNQQQQLGIAPHCWDNPRGQLCVPRPIELGLRGQAALQVKRLDLSILKPWLPAGTKLHGELTSNADVRWDTSRPALNQGRLTLSGQGVKVSQTVDNNQLRMALNTVDVNLRLRNNMAQLDWLLRINNNGQFDGMLQVTDPQSRRGLSGNINLHNFSLSIINALLSSDQKADGQLDASLRLAGNLQQPQLLGTFTASDIKFAGNIIPFDMQPSQLAIVFNGMESSLEGVLHTRKGQINLQGSADWHKAENWRASINAQGERVRLTVPPVVLLDVSPNVRLEASPQSIHLTGNINVPWARITVHELPESAVSVSSDVVMLNNNLQPIHKNTTSIPINSDLQIHVGDDVQLDAFGLKARLTGNLLVSQDKQTLGLSGQIKIPQGRFRAYGQDLLVRQGELLFSGSPDHVLLNMEAIRNPESTENGVIAGVRVSGSSDNPHIEVFSDPAMSQQEALSYLLRGQGLQSQQSNSEAMTSALVGLGVAQSGRIIGKIGETFGITNLTLDTESVGSGSQVVLSGYVLPGLQVKYGVGIFDSLATLTLRYRLLPRLYLEAVSGVDQALDLLYQFEF